MDVTEWEAVLADMVADWHRLLVSTAADDSMTVSRSVSEWDTLLGDMVDEQARLRAAGRWVVGPDDLLAVTGLDRSEVVHSAVLAWLLDPRMRHGLGVEFLRRLIERCFPDEIVPALHDARCECEVARGAARADIVVWADEWTIVIENKVGAPEGPGQCDAYYRLFADDPGPHFVFLSPSGRRPFSATGEAADAYRSVSYYAVCDDLRAALAATSANRDTPGRAAVTQYLATLERMFP